MSEKKSTKEPIIRDIKPVEIVLQSGKYFWCACGRSQKHPFCDGSHYGTEIKPVRFVIENEHRVYLCSCKMSKTKPFCDSSHKNLNQNHIGKTTSML